METDWFIKGGNKERKMKQRRINELSKRPEWSMKMNNKELCGFNFNHQQACGNYVKVAYDIEIKS